MGVQLIVYPQSYDGSYNYVSNWGGEFMVDGLNFTTINSAQDLQLTASPSLDEVLSVRDAVTQQPAVINTWKRYKTSSMVLGGTIEGAGTLIMDIEAQIPFEFNSTGAYQQLSGLVVGQNYTIELQSISNVGSPDTKVMLSVFKGSTNNLIASSVVFDGSMSQPATVDFTFTAQTTNDVVAVTAFSDPTSQTDNVLIAQVSVFEQGIVPTTLYDNLQDGQVIVDIYEDEDIPLTLSIDDFKNVAEQVHSYSKAFNLPATKRNNQIFDNIFQITRTTQNSLNFNPYVRTQCCVKQDGFILFEGFLRLIDITDKEGEISYNVNLYSEVITLAEVLEEKTFDFIDFTELDHSYDFDTIELSWNDSGSAFPYTNPSTSGFRTNHSTVKYPFVDWTHQILVSDGNLPTNAGVPELTKLEQAFRPFIQVKYLIDRIFQDTNQFSYTSNFFNTDNFKKLYMDFNWGSDENGAATEVQGFLHQQHPAGAANFFLNEDNYNSQSYIKFSQNVSNPDGLYSYWNNTFYKWTSPVNNLEVETDIFVRLDNVGTSATYSNNIRLAKFNAIGQVIEVLGQNNDAIPHNVSKTFICQVSTTLQSGEYLQVQSYVSTFAADNNKVKMHSLYDSYFKITVTNNAVQVVPLLTALRGELGQWDFLKGIMTMFNLISIPDPQNANNILIEPYEDVFINNTSGISLASRSIKHDWTEKIDITQIKLKPLTDLEKKTNFKFVEDDEDEAFRVYKRDVQGHLYGSKIANEVNATALTGEKDIIAEPFAATIPKPLAFQYQAMIVPSIYTMDEEGVTGAFSNSPRIMFNNGLKAANQDYYVPTQNGVAAHELTGYLQFSHLTEIPTVTSIPPALTDTVDFHFGACQLIAPIGNPTTNNLFNMYWAVYYNELYNPDTRIMTIKVNLNPADINMFNFFDTVMIKNREFRVNKIEYKPHDLSTVEFILIP